MTSEHLTGLIAAPHTPFGPDGELNLVAVEQQARWLTDQGLTGAFICGTTGEGLSLSVEERMRLAERWVEVAASDLKVIVHVGHNSLRDARQLAEHARKIRPSAVAVMPPSFFRPQGVEELVELCEMIAEPAGDLPLYYYHIPALSGVSVSVHRFLERAAERIPTLRGVKYTHNDLMEYRQCLRLDGGRFDVLFGRDEILLAGLTYGARGAVGSTYNYAAPVYLRMIEAFEAGDLDAARRAADRSIEIVGVIRSLGELAAGKAIMSLLGVECGPPRPPLRPVSDDDRAQLERCLESWQLKQPSGATDATSTG